MHLHHSVLPISLFFAILGTVSAYTQPQPTKHPSLLASTGNVDIKKNLLRSNNVDVVIDTSTKYKPDSAERASMPKLAQLDQATWKLRKLNMKLSEKIWFAAGYTPAYLFKTLNKGTESIAERKKLLQWLRFTQTYRKKKGVYRLSDEDISALLEKHIAHAKMAVIFQEEHLRSQVFLLRDCKSVKCNIRKRLRVGSKQDT
ncbi:hypothetical protein ON010_g11055 [Phytophthora cinnamomi]|nr:hypothetical protein ON010_g11055 [Phytophthora cinnamomi]